MCGCGKGFSQKQNLARHGKSCNVYIDRKSKKLPLNIPASERTKFTLDQFINKHGTTINNNDYSTTNHNDNSTHTTNNNYITNNYNLKVDYLNPITAYETNHMDPEKTWKLYSKNCGETGIGCLIEKLFENDANTNINCMMMKNI